ncbi:MAG TPA: heme lyase CcmF/NrfE family subunit [Gammaproteobacteria bacterium]|nr:heme lyase CcmF/NrfE family subunit [Gammaproteobacteria bacterium]
MLVEIGHFCVIIALCMALLQVCAYSSKLSNVNIMRPMSLGQSFFICLAFCILIIAFLRDDFTVAYVARNSNSTLPFYYKFTALWGAHEGSLLLWTLILSLWSLAIAICSRTWPLKFANHVLVVFSAVNIGFLSILLYLSNPFLRTFANIPLDGNDLNPLLQDFGMIIHPPILYMGYVGCTVPFAFAIAALLNGKVDQTWARIVQPWALAAWMFLTLGIALGSWWAYYELGWGGWWFWDPVENASFMPWLTATALVHCLAVAKRNGQLLRLAIFLCIVTFALSLLGTFLVRSGSIISVHAFAKDPKRGMYILLFLSIVIGSAFALYVLRAWRLQVPSEAELNKTSKLILFNNVVLLVAGCSVLLGTMYPLLHEWLYDATISVGYPYFNKVFAPLMCLLFVIMIYGLTESKRKLMLTLVVAALLALAVLYTAFAAIKLTAFIGLMLAIAIFIISFNTRNVAMSLAHIGLAVTIAGVSITPAYEIERDLRMQVGDQIQIANYAVAFKNISALDGPNYIGFKGDFAISKHNKPLATLYPEKRIYLIQETAMSETAILPGLLQDIYIALGQQIDQNTWSVRVYYKPFVRWIWLGAIIMALGAGCGVLRRKCVTDNKTYA